jgi:hypothetical protein
MSVVNIYLFNSSFRKLFYVLSFKY